MTATAGPNPGEKRVSGEIPQTDAPKSDEPLRAGTLAEICRAFLKLGLTSFGGPVAHLGYFRDEFVHRRQWLSDAAYADLVALCQFLPGPSSTQLAFILGLRQAKLPGGLVASLCFTLPSAVLMILFGIGISSLGDWRHAGWLHGLKLAAVVVVAQAVWGMGRALCPDRTRLAIALASAAALLVLTHPVAQISVVAAGSLLGWWHYRTQANAGPQPAAIGWRNHLPAAISLGIFFLMLLLLPILAAVTGSKGIEVFGGFYRVGSLVFGGGHVVLPLLRSEVVPKGMGGRRCVSRRLWGCAGLAWSAVYVWGLFGDGDASGTGRLAEWPVVSGGDYAARTVAGGRRVAFLESASGQNLGAGGVARGECGRGGHVAGRILQSGLAGGHPERAGCRRGDCLIWISPLLQHSALADRPAGCRLRCVSVGMSGLGVVVYLAGQGPAKLA